MTPARRLGYPTECLTCESPIEPHERAFVEHGVGAWHEDCDPPRNLPLYRRERDRDRSWRLTARLPAFDDDDD